MKQVPFLNNFPERNRIETLPPQLRIDLSTCVSIHRDGKNIFGVVGPPITESRNLNNRFFLSLSLLTISLIIILLTTFVSHPLLPCKILHFSILLEDD